MATKKGEEKWWSHVGGEGRGIYTVPIVLPVRGVVDYRTGGENSFRCLTLSNEAEDMM